MGVLLFKKMYCYATSLRKCIVVSQVSAIYWYLECLLVKYDFRDDLSLTHSSSRFTVTSRLQNLTRTDLTVTLSLLHCLTSHL